ncbi:hypothetical protein [Pseudomonas sp. SIMBA_021]|uniref:hypothetical protein n=1 Tax=Pseudomonas sp. SIMBA_021 TaxID=3085767 RepID=UPI00397E023A
MQLVPLVQLVPPEIPVLLVILVQRELLDQLVPPEILVRLVQPEIPALLDQLV